VRRPKSALSGRPFFVGGRDVIPWSEARRRLVEGGTFWLATALPDGGPHLMPVLGVWAREGLHFVSNERSRKARNLVTEARCVLGLGSAGIDLVVEGTARRVEDEAALREVADAYRSKYGWHVSVRKGALHGAEGAPTAGPPPYLVFVVTVTRAFAFGTSEPPRPTRYELV
jgi:hypothetical protein